MASFCADARLSGVEVSINNSNMGSFQQQDNVNNSNATRNVAQALIVTSISIIISIVTNRNGHSRSEINRVPIFFLQSRGKVEFRGGTSATFFRR